MFPRRKETSWTIKQNKCIVISYKDGVKGYKLWNPVTMKIVQSCDMIFREVKSTHNHEDEIKRRRTKENRI
jgi:hypothetical protein